MKVKLTEHDIARSVMNATSPAEAILNMYKVCYPVWDSIEKITGYPKVSRKTSSYIIDLGIGKFGHEFTYFWITKGFGISKDASVSDWEADLSDVVLHWKENMSVDEFVHCRANAIINERGIDITQDYPPCTNLKKK